MASDSTLTEIRNRLDLVDVVSDYVSLKKAGTNYKGLCPFHSEKTASFIVSPEKQIYHCFGCHEGGDLFGFLMKMEGLTFPEAIEKLASRAGVEIRSDKEKKISKNEKEILYQANRIAAQVSPVPPATAGGGGDEHYRDSILPHAFNGSPRARGHR